MMLLGMSIFVASIVSTELNVNLLMVVEQLRIPIMVVRIVEPCCLLTKIVFVTGALKVDKNRQNTLFYAKKR